MGEIGAASFLTLHKNAQPLEKYAAFLWVIMRAQLSSVIPLQKKEEGNFIVSCFSSCTLYDMKFYLNQNYNLAANSSLLSNMILCSYRTGSTGPQTIYLSEFIRIFFM